MSKTTTAQQLQKVMVFSRGISTVLQIVQAFAGMGIALTFIALVFASSFQLNLGNGELGITFFSADEGQAVINVYDAKNRFGPSVETEVPTAAQVTRLVITPDSMLRVSAGVLLFAQVSVVMLVLEHLAKLFAHYGKGDIFISAAVTRIRKVGYTLLALPVISLLNSAFAAVLVARLSDGEMSSLHFDMNIAALFAAIVVITISRIMDVGRAIQEENELTI